MRSQVYLKKIMEFCTSISTKITFDTNMYDYNLSENEYNKAYNDFYDYFQGEDVKRRAQFAQDMDYKNKLLDSYQTEKEVFDYLDRLQQYDLFQLNELRIDLEELMKLPNSNSLVNPLASSSFTSKFSLPEDAYQGSVITFRSRCTIGGLCLYKVYTFSFTDSMKSFLSNLEEIFHFFEFDNIKTLDAPDFYSGDTLIFSVDTYEYPSILYLSEEQYNQFKLLDVPYSLG